MAKTFQLKILSLKSEPRLLSAQKVIAPKVMDALPMRRGRDRAATGARRTGQRTARTMRSRTQDQPMAARRAATVHKIANKLYLLHASICSLEFKCHSSL